MDRYLGGQLLAIIPVDSEGKIDFQRLGLAGALAAVWDWALRTYTSVHAWDPALTAVAFLWSCDMILGTLASYYRGDLDPQTGRLRMGEDGRPLTGWRVLSSERAKRGVGKLVLWGLAFLVTWPLYRSTEILPRLFAGLVRAYILLTESGSSLRNLGRLGGHQGLERLGQLGEGEADGLAGGRSSGDKQ